MRKSNLFSISKSGTRLAKRAREASPCVNCRGRGEVVFDESALGQALQRGGFEVVRVIGEAYLVCPACGGEGYE